MIGIIIAIIVIYIIYLGVKGNKDIQNVNKYGGLRNKYSVFINHIMSRNSYYQLRELNTNNIEIANTGMMFKLIEIDKKLQVTWVWQSFSTGKTHKLQWLFNEFENQDSMYEKVDKGMTIQNYIDDGMNQVEAEDWFKISRSTNKIEQDTLVESFSKKYPALWDRMIN